MLWPQPVKTIDNSIALIPRLITEDNRLPIKDDTRAPLVDRHPDPGRVIMERDRMKTINSGVRALLL